MKKINRLFIFTLLVLLFFVSSCDNGSKDKYSYPYDFSCQFELCDLPTGTRPENLAFVLQISPDEKSNTNLLISKFQVLKNNEVLWTQKNFESTIEYNTWINDDGVADSNYQVIYYCMPQNSNTTFALGDIIDVIFECEADRTINNPVFKWLIDNSEEVGLWKNLGVLKREAPVKPDNPTSDSENPADDSEKTDPKNPVSDSENSTPENSDPENAEPDNKYSYNHSYKYLYKITRAPFGNKPENVTLAFQMPKNEGSETNYKITDLKVTLNGNTIKDSAALENKFWYNQFTTSDGGTDGNYLTIIKLLPQNFDGQVKVNDKLSLQFNLNTDREFVNKPIPYLIDNTEAANYWLVLGEETFDYPATALPNEKITYNGISYKLVFYDDFDKDFSELNPLKNGMYKQAFDMNNWWTEDWGSYVGTANGLEHRSIRDFKIHDGMAEFPMIRRRAAETGDWANAGPSIVTSIWDPKGVNSVPLYEFNKGIFEIKFKGPEGNNHPGQFTFWVLNYNTNFEAGRIPTNPKKAADGYALDEIDFFEYSPSLNKIRTGTRSCNSVNSRPAAGYEKVALADDFGGKWHVFRCVWDENGLTSYLDGVKIYNISASRIKGFDNPNDKFMLLISSQSIKESGMDGDVDSVFEPYSYFVDYVKVYEKE